MPGNNKRKQSDAGVTDDRVSKRQQRLANVSNPGKDDKEKGTVQHDQYGNLTWWHQESSTWKYAVYHNDIRQTLIDRASLNGTLRYTHPREEGGLPGDVTAYHQEQQDWNGNRDSSGIRDDILNRLEKNGYTCRDAGVDPEYMYEYMDYERKVVLDGDNHPVKIFPSIHRRDTLPSTLSSGIEDWYLEAIGRLDERIQRRDILARLPLEYRQKDGITTKPIFTLPALGNKRDRYRGKEGLLAWDKRTGSDAMEQYIKTRLTQDYPAALANNTTRGVPAPTPKKRKEARAQNMGKFPEKATGRNISDEERARRANKKPHPRARQPSFNSPMPLPSNLALPQLPGYSSSNAGASSSFENFNPINVQSFDAGRGVGVWDSDPSRQYPAYTANASSHQNYHGSRQHLGSNMVENELQILPFGGPTQQQQPQTYAPMPPVHEARIPEETRNSSKPDPHARQTRSNQSDAPSQGQPSLEASIYDDQTVEDILCDLSEAFGNESRMEGPDFHSSIVQSPSPSVMNTDTSEGGVVTGSVGETALTPNDIVALRDAGFDVSFTAQDRTSNGALTPEAPKFSSPSHLGRGAGQKRGLDELDQHHDRDDEDREPIPKRQNIILEDQEAAQEVAARATSQEEIATDAAERLSQAQPLTAGQMRALQAQNEGPDSANVAGQQAATGLANTPRETNLKRAQTDDDQTASPRAHKRPRLTTEEIEQMLMDPNWGQASQLEEVSQLTENPGITEVGQTQQVARKEQGDQQQPPIQDQEGIGAGEDAHSQHHIPAVQSTPPQYMAGAQPMIQHPQPVVPQAAIRAMASFTRNAILREAGITEGCQIATLTPLPPQPSNMPPVTVTPEPVPVATSSSPPSPAEGDIYPMGVQNFASHVPRDDRERRMIRDALIPTRGSYLKHLQAMGVPNPILPLTNEGASYAVQFETIRHDFDMAWFIAQTSDWMGDDAEVMAMQPELEEAEEWRENRMASGMK